MQQDSDKRLRVGLVGAGNICEFHIRAIQHVPNARIEGIFDLDQQKALAMAGRFSLNRVFGSLEELCSACDVVHVLTPPSSHAAVAVRALEHGCHVLIEKPLAASVEECDRVIAAARAAGRIACVNHSLLYDRFIGEALRLARSGRIGKVLAVEYLRSSDCPPYAGGPLPPQYRDGGYPFRDLGVHALYLMQAFLGEIRGVHAQFRCEGGDPNLMCDEWRANVRCEHGLGNIQLSWNVRPLQHVLVVQGTRGVVRADVFSMTVTCRFSKPLPKIIERPWNAGSEAWQTLAQVPLNMLRFMRGRILPYHGVQMLVRDFYVRLAAGQQPPVSASDARDVVGWTEFVAREGDEAKNRFLSRFATSSSANVLVTGASGFVGRNLVHRLVSAGGRVRVLVRREPPDDWLHHPDIDVFYGDLGDAGAVERAVAGCDLVYHVGAAMSGGAHDFDRGTVAGTRNVVDACVHSGVRQLVYISSLSVLHAAAGPGIVTEEWPLEPHPERRGHYSRTKLEAERIVLDAVKERGLRAILLRPGRIFGPGAELMTPDVARRVKGRMLVLGNGKFAPPLVYITDLIDGIIAAGKSAIGDGRIYHLVGAGRLTQNDLIREYLQAKAGNDKVWHLPLWLVKLLATGVEILGAALRRPVPLSRYRVKSALTELTFDCSAAQRDLGWASRVGLVDGVHRTLTATSQEAEEQAATARAQ